MFLQEEPLGVGDRVMAGLSVAFDASCEEMWLAWRYGGCLVPAPRALVRSGVDVGPWLVANAVTVVSTVPTLVALWPTESLARVRLLIMGGEACPPELVTRLLAPGREVWNTYGPTEATVVACGTELTGDGPVRIGLPLDGWDLAVVDGVRPARRAGRHRRADHRRRRPGPLPRPGPGRREVRRDADPGLGARLSQRRPGRLRPRGAALRRPRRRPGQARWAPHRARRDRQRPARPARRRGRGRRRTAVRRRQPAARRLRRGRTRRSTRRPPSSGSATTCPPRSCPGSWSWTTCRPARPGRSTGTPCRGRCPPPVPRRPRRSRAPRRGSRSSGSTCSAPRSRSRPTTSSTSAVAASPPPRSSRGSGSATPRSWSATSTSSPPWPPWRRSSTPCRTPGSGSDRTVPPTPLKTQAGQVVATLGLRALAGPRWLTWTAVGCHVASSALGRDLAAARALAAAGGGRTGLRERTRTDAARGGRRPAPAARAVPRPAPARRPGPPPALGGRPGRRRARGHGAGRRAVDDLVRPPPRREGGPRRRPAQPAAGHGDAGPRRAAARSSPRSTSAATGWTATSCTWARSGCGPGPGSAPAACSCPGPTWARTPRWPRAPRSSARSPPGSTGRGHPPGGSPATARGPWAERPTSSRLWVAAYGAGGARPGRAAAARRAGGSGGGPGRAPAPPTATTTSSPWPPGSRSATVVGLVVLAALVWVVVRIAGLAIAPGVHPVRGGRALAVWITIRVLDEARTWLFPLYSSQLTPALAAEPGRPDRPRRRGVDGADDPLADPGERRGVPGRRHPDRRLRARRRTAARRAGQDRQAGLRRQLRDGRPGPPGPEGVAGRRALGGARGARAPGRASRGWAARRRRCGERPLPRTSSGPTGRPCGSRWRAAWSSCAGSCRWCSPSRSTARSRSPSSPSSTGRGSLVALLLAGPLLAAAGCVAAVVTVAAKWLLVGRIRPGNHPLWSSFVWRNELADTFVEVLAAPWFARAVAGTPAAQRLVPGDGRADRPRRVVRDLLAARDRPRRPRATAPPSTRAAWCRPTCSTTGCSAWTRSPCAAAPRSARTA